MTHSYKKRSALTLPEKTIISAQFVKVVNKLIADGKFKNNKSFAEYYGYAKSLITHIRTGRQNVPLELLYEVVLDWGINPYFLFGISREIYGE